MKKNILAENMKRFGTKNLHEQPQSQPDDKIYDAILNLPVKARFGVYVAYKYYLSLFKKIKKANPSNILEQRIRIPNYGKAFIVAKAGLRSQLNIL